MPWMQRLRIVQLSQLVMTVQVAIMTVRVFVMVMQKKIALVIAAVMQWWMNAANVVVMALMKAIVTVMEM
jgi:hypothetical protein